MPVQEQSSSFIAELSPIIALDAIYVFFLLYRDRASNSWSIKASSVLFIVSAAGLLALTFILRAKQDGGLVIATIILQYLTTIFQQICTLSETKEYIKRTDFLRSAIWLAVSVLYQTVGLIFQCVGLGSPTHLLDVGFLVSRIGTTSGYLEGAWSYFRIFQQREKGRGERNWGACCAIWSLATCCAGGAVIIVGIIRLLRHIDVFILFLNEIELLVFCFSAVFGFIIEIYYLAVSSRAATGSHIRVEG